MKKGVLAGVAAYTLWGLLPVYWKALQTVPALEILVHRTVWSLVFVLLLQAILRRWDWLRLVRQQPRMLRIFLGSTVLLSVNWLTYIWAVNAGHVVDASLGYFINPLVSVLLGMIFLGERLRPWQGVAVGLAAVSVLYLTLGLGSLPWIALMLAGTFGFYGLLRKTAPLGSMEGLSVETALLSLPALAYLLALEATGQGSFGHAGATTSLLLAFTGVVTAVPLLLFAWAARNTTLATVGILQYIAPTFQFLLGLLVYHEPFSPARLLGFGGVWLALVIYTGEALMQERHRRAAAAAGTG
ncbi:MAG: EamA family transporter RarD [Anaerolineaceae bacterium]|nr:EamA family transporter RarD [Anaerolineaceae bacterium]